MCSRTSILITTVVLMMAVSLAAQTTPAASSAAPQQTTTPKVKTVPAPYSDPTSGKAMYDAYCASCHGADAKGNGPAAPAMKTPPTDLTMLAAKNGGTFPAAHVAAEIKGDALTPSHGGKDMPVWGPVFKSMGQHQSSEVQLRIRNLVKYLDSIQQK